MDKAVQSDMIGSQNSQRTGDTPKFTNKDLGGNIINNISDSYIHLTAELKDHGWKDEIIGRVESVLKEIVENAITHGNMYSEKRSVKLEYIIHDGVLEVSVTDEGYGLKYNSLSSVAIDSMPQENQHHGFHLVSALADEVYFSEAGKTIWVMFDNR
jgi:anti-sigma regulatory factor (Ser/Thr protein kinase)